MIDSEIFGQIKPWKNPHGENQLERERFYYFFKIKIRHSFSQKSNLSQLRKMTSKLPRFLCKSCLGFRAISVSKNSLEITALPSSISVHEQQTAVLDFCARTDPKISQRPYGADCIKCSRTTSKSVPEI